MGSRALIAAAGLIASSCATQHVATTASATASAPRPFVVTLGTPRFDRVLAGPPAQLMSRPTIFGEVGAPRASVPTGFLDVLALARLPPVGDDIARAAPPISEITCVNLSDALCSSDADRSVRLAAVAVARQCLRSADETSRSEARGAVLRCVITDDDELRLALGRVLAEDGIVSERAAPMIPTRAELAAQSRRLRRVHGFYLATCALAPHTPDSLVIACRGARQDGCRHDIYYVDEYAVSDRGWARIAGADSPPQSCLER